MPKSQFYLKKPMINSIIYELQTATNSLVGFLYIEKGPQQFIEAGNDVLTKLNVLKTKIDIIDINSEEAFQECNEALKRIVLDLYNLGQVVAESDDVLKSENINDALEFVYELTKPKET